MKNDGQKGAQAPGDAIADVPAATDAAEDVVDGFCWTAAQVLRRILGLAQAGDEQGDADSPDTQEEK